MSERKTYILDGAIPENDGLKHHIQKAPVLPSGFFECLLSVLNGAWRLTCLVVFMYAVCAFQSWHMQEAQRELTGHIAKTLISRGYKAAGNVLVSSKALCSDPTLQEQCVDYLVSKVRN